MTAPAFPALCRGKTSRKRRKRSLQRQHWRRHLRFEPLEDRRVLASIAGQLVYDFDGNGVANPYEPGQPDWRIYIDENGNGQFDADEPSALTDANGQYLLDDLSPGFYTLRRVPQSGWEQTFPPEPGKLTVNIRNFTQEVAGINFAEQRLFTPFVPGNLLVTRSSFLDNDLLLEYTTDGQLVQAIVIPGTAEESRLIAKDLVLDSRGNLQIYHGCDDVRLTTFTPVTATFSQTLVPGWDMGNTFDQWGDIAAFGQYVFANEQVADGGTADGVIRFNVRDLSYTRFSGGFGLVTDLTVGLDGLLYTLDATVNKTTILVHNPETMDLVRAFDISQRLHSVAVDAGGNLFAITDTGLKHYTSEGVLVKSAPNVNGLDIAIDSSGSTLVIPADLWITTIATATTYDADNEPRFQQPSSFPLPGTVAENFLAFAAFVQKPLGETPAVVVDYGVFTPGNILVSNSPKSGGVPKLYEYTPFGALVQEFDLPLPLDNTGPRDLATDASGNVQIYNGTFAPRLTTFDSKQGEFDPDPAQFYGWSSANVPTYGGLASYANYVFATDDKTQYDTSREQGIVRYNLATGTAERFSSEDGETIDLNVGQDGLLYTLSTPQVWQGNPSAVTVTSGTDFNSLFEDDSELLDVRGVRGATGSLGFDVRLEFASVPDSPVAAFFKGWYQPAAGAPAHNVKLQIYNYFTANWDNVTANVQDFPAATGEQWYRFELPTDLRNYGGNVEMRLRVYGQRTYNSPPLPQDDTHHLYLDQVQLVSVRPGSAGTSRPATLTVAAGMAAFDRVTSLIADDAKVIDVPELRGLAGDPAFDFQVEFSNVLRDAAAQMEVVFQGWYSAPDGTLPHDVKLQLYDVWTSRWEDVTFEPQDFPVASGEQTYTFALPHGKDLPRDLTRYVTGAIGGRGTLRLRVSGERSYDSPPVQKNDELHHLYVDQVWLQGTRVGVALPNVAPSALTVSGGRDVSSLLADDADVLDVGGIRGAAGDTALDVQMEFSGVPNVPMEAIVVGWFSPPEGVAAHNLVLQIYNVTTARWENVTGNTRDIPGGTSEQTYEFELPGDLAEFITGGENGTLRLRIYGTRGYASPRVPPPLVDDTYHLYLDQVRLRPLEPRTAGEQPVNVFGVAVSTGDISFSDVLSTQDDRVRDVIGASGVTGVPAFNVEIEFNGVRNVVTDVILDGWYSPPAGRAHTVALQVFNVSLQQWEDLGFTFPPAVGQRTYQVRLPYSTSSGLADYLTSDASQTLRLRVYGLRSYDSPAQSDIHHLYLDRVVLRQGQTVSPSAATVLAGTAVFSPIQSVQAYDGDSLEVAGVRAGGVGYPSFEIQLEFSQVRNVPMDVVVVGHYDAPAGQTSHNVRLQIYNVAVSTWQNVTRHIQDFPNATADEFLEFELPRDLTSYLMGSGGGEGRLRLRVYSEKASLPEPPEREGVHRMFLNHVYLREMHPGAVYQSVVRQYDPVSMELLKTVNLPANLPHRAIAVDANGDIFAADPEVYRYNHNGESQGAPLYARGIGPLSDIDLDADGRVLLAASGGQILVTDRSFTGLYTFLTRFSDGMNFAAFVSPDRPLPKARWDSFTVQQASSGNELDVLANDVPKDGDLVIAGVRSPSQGGSVSVVSKTFLVSSLDLHRGTLPTGTLGSLSQDDGDILTIAAVVGTPGLDVEFGFQDTPDQLLDLRLRGYYQGPVENGVKLQVWNFDTSQWDNLTSFASDIPPASGEQSYRWRLPVGDYRSAGGERRVKIVQTAAGYAGDRLYLDQVVLEGQALRYTPAKAWAGRPDFVGTETFTYTVSRISPAGDVQLNRGTFASGNLGSALADDDQLLTIAEVLGSPGLDVEFVFQNTPDQALDLRLQGRYQATTGRGVKIQLWNYDTLQWENLTSDPSDIWHATSEQSYRWTLPAGRYRDSDGQRQVKILQSLPGATANRLYLDALFLEGRRDEALVQVTVTGNGNFFTFDESYSSNVTQTGNYRITEDGRPAATVLAAEGVLVNDGRPDIFPVLTPGNILITHSPIGDGAVPLLQEYTPDGTLVRSVPLPSYSGETGDVGDVVLDRKGNVQVYNGTSTPRLTTYDPVAATLFHAQYPYWNTPEDKLGGGLAAWRNFVYATDQAATGEDLQQHAGIVRFDIEAGTAEPFVRGANFSDVTVGLDGFLYALGTSSDGTGRFIRVYNPLTGIQLREIRGLPLQTRAITVAADGTIYAVRHYAGFSPDADFCDYDSRDNPYVYEYRPNGTLRRIWDLFGIGYRKPSPGQACVAGWQPTTGWWAPGHPARTTAEEYASESDFSDIDLSEDGRTLLIANINQSNSVLERVRDVVVFDLRTATAETWDAPNESSDMKFAAWVQAPVSAVNGPLFVSAYTPPSHGRLDCNPLDATLDGVAPEGSFCYTPDPNYSGRDSFFYVVSDVDGKQRGSSVALTVAPQNDPPVLTAAGPSVTSDDNHVLTVPLTALINGGLGTETNADEDPNDGLCTYRRGHAVFQCGTTTITDHDPSDPLGGIAVTDLTGPGVWSFSLDGSVFVEFGTVSPTNALLLPPSADVRFTPSIGLGGTATFTYVAWDQSTGIAGSRAPVTYQQCVAGGVPDASTGLCQNGTLPVERTYGAYSQDADQQPVMDTWTVTLAALNDAPVLVAMNPEMGTTDEHTSGEAVIGDFVTQVFDPDGSNQLQGIVLIGATGQGFWEYSLDGSTYYLLPAVTSKQALILEPNHRLRYTPDGLNGEVATVTYRAWDKTDGALAGEWVDASRFGGLTAYSETADTGLFIVTDVNDAPVLAPQSPTIGQTDVMTPITVVLERFVQGITDVDRGAVIGGIAITHATGEGTWSYSLNGTSFFQFPPLSTSSALLLRGSDMIRYTPAGGSPETATIAYRAWDTTRGAPGDTADVTDNGGETAFSVATDDAVLTVKEVNDPPVIGGFVVPLAYTENDPPTPIVGDATVFDPDSADFAGGRLEVGIISGGTSSDRLVILEANGISLAGDTVIYESGGPQWIGNWSAAGWLLSVHFTTMYATQEAAEALLRSVAYKNVSENPSTANRRIQISLTDGDGGNQTRTVTQTVTMQAVNDPPLAKPDQYSTLSGQKLVLNRSQGVLANDRDPEGTTLSARLVETTRGGVLTLNADGSLTYQPDPLFLGQDSFSYEAWDGQAASAPVRVNIDVRPKPTNPAHPADVNADGFLSPLDAVLIVNYLLRNGAGSVPAWYEAPPFVDYNGDGSVTPRDVDRTVADIDNGGARPVPPPSLVLPQTPPSPGPGVLARVTLKITDAAGAPISSIQAGQAFYLEAWVSDQRSVPLGVAAAYLDVTYPGSLVAVGGAISVGAEFPLFAAGQTATAGLIDEAGAGRTTTLPDAQEHLLWRIPMLGQARGNAVFTADPADNQPAGQFLLFGFDGPLDSYVNVEYLGATLQLKGPPTAAGDAYRVDEDDLLAVTAVQGVLANDYDEEGDPLTALLADAPSHGTLQLSATGAFTYQPDPDFFGTDRFTYRANDGFFDSNLATVTITVTGVNDPPVAVPDIYSVRRNNPRSVSAVNGLLANDYDVEGDPLTVLLVQSPAHGQLTLRADGSFDYTPATDYGGPDGFTYKAFDGTAESNETAVHLDVSFGWRNPYHPVDINGDGYASPIDALLSFNDFAVHGVRMLPDPPGPPDVPPPFLDFNGDNLSSDFDGKKVLADLNANGSRLLEEPRLELPQTPLPLSEDTLVRFHLEMVNAQGQAVSTVSQGETFFLNVYAADLRPSGTGVFSAYLDVDVDQAAALTVAGPIQFGSGFPNVRAGSTTAPGLLDEAGAVRTATPDGVKESLLLQVPLAATASGTFTVAANPADVLPAGQVTLYGINSPIPPDNIEYGSLQVTVVCLDSDGDGVMDLEEDGAPYGGDGNQDGIPDRLQSSVASLRSSASLPYVTIAASPQVSLTNVSAVEDPAPGTKPSNVDFPLGFFRFDASGIAAGGATTITIYARAGTNANTYYGYGPTPDNAAPHWYAFLFDGVTGATVFADRMELHLADGQRGDADPRPSRISFGPGGSAFSPTPWTNPRDPLDVNNDGFVTPADALMMINAINISGPRTLPPIPAGGDALPPFRDTNWDNVLEAADVLNIVNFLNSTAAGEGEWAGAREPALGCGLPHMTAWTSQGIAASPLPAVPVAGVRRPEQTVSANRRHLDTLRQTAVPMRVSGNLHLASGPQPVQESSRLSAAAMDFDQALDEIAEDVAQIWGLD